MTEIYLIRHTQAQGNRYQGSWDGAITALGRRQIEALAERFSKIPVDAVYSSDLRRAVLTAEAAARRGQLPIQTRTALRELDVGPWEKCFFGNVRHAQPELARAFLEDAEHWRLEGAETFGEVRRRALAELRRIAQENEGRTVAVASHGITIRCIMSGITGISLSEPERLPIFRNTAVTRLLWDGSAFHVDYMNDVSHLPQDAQSSWNTAGDLRDERFDPERDREYYEACYADAWRAAHGATGNTMKPATRMPGGLPTGRCTDSARTRITWRRCGMTAFSRVRFCACITAKSRSAWWIWIPCGARNRGSAGSACCI